MLLSAQLRQPNLFAQWESEPPEPPRRRVHRRKDLIPSDAEVRERKRRAGMSAEAVRNLLVSRLDDALLSLRDVCEERYGIVDELFLRLVQDVQMALFPEAFCEPDEMPDYRGLIPRPEDNRGRPVLVPAEGWEALFRKLRQVGNRQAKAVTA